MTITLYDLAGADRELRFSPYCWRTKLALAHKQIAYETIPWHFTEKEKLAFCGQTKVPVIVDGERTIADSWAIASYLEERYPDRPSLFGGVAGQAHMRFINGWADAILQPGIARLIVLDILQILRPEDQSYFRLSRERAFGMKLEEVVKGREQAVEEFRKMLSPIRMVLRGQPWLGGEAPDYADYTVLGSFMWPLCASRFTLLDTDDPVAEWRARGLALFDGLGAKARTV
jgi:glutathione S-transferase